MREMVDSSDSTGSEGVSHPRKRRRIIIDSDEEELVSPSQSKKRHFNVSSSSTSSRLRSSGTALSSSENHLDLLTLRRGTRAAAADAMRRVSGMIREINEPEPSIQGAAIFASKVHSVRGGKSDEESTYSSNSHGSRKISDAASPFVPRGTATKGVSDRQAALNARRDERLQAVKQEFLRAQHSGQKLRTSALSELRFSSSDEGVEIPETGDTLRQSNDSSTRHCSRRRRSAGSFFAGRRREVEYEDRYADLYATGDDEMADFLVDSEEERRQKAERRKQRKDRAEKLKRRKYGQQSHGNDMKKTDGMMINLLAADEESDVENRVRPRRGASSSGKSRRNDLVILDSDAELAPVTRGKGIDASVSSEEKDSSSSSDQSDSVDEQAVYLRVNQIIDQQNEIAENSPLQTMRKSYPVSVAMRLYIEMLALSLIDAQFMILITEKSTSSLHLLLSSSKSKDTRRYPYPHHEVDRVSEYISATRQIENLLGTHRESVVGTGAWTGQYNQNDFHHELLERPFFHWQNLSVDKFLSQDRPRCDACGRTAHRPDVEVILAGRSYDSKRAWSSGRWDGALAAMRSIFFHRGFRPPLCDDPDNCIFSESEDNSGGSSSDSDANSSKSEGSDALLPRWLQRQPTWLQGKKASLWYLSQHCTARSRLYHTLLHYKLRLLLKIRAEVARLVRLRTGQQFGTNTDRSPLQEFEFDVLLKAVTELLKADGDDGVAIGAHAIEGLHRHHIISSDFVRQETRRFQSLINKADNRYGGIEQRMANIWSDDEKETNTNRGKVKVEKAEVNNGTRAAPIDAMCRPGSSRR